MAEHLKRMLMIAYYFPPLGGAGVQRSAKFAKYLARLGWRVDVVTVVPPPFEPLDVSLQAEVANDFITINRVPYDARFRRFDKIPGGWRLRAFLDDWLQFPDRMQGWQAPAFTIAEKMCRENPGLVVFSTSAPYTAHLIARELKRRYGNPWIADFRDEWSQNPYLTFASPFHKHRHREAERSVLNEADAVISVTENIIKGLEKLDPSAKTEFFTIPNGFDPDDFKGLVPVAAKQWIIIHVGTLNRAREELLRPVISTLQNLIADGVIPMSDVKMELIGTGDWQNSGFTDLEWLKTCQYLPHSEALAALSRCQLAVLAESNPAAFTGKIFEYLALQKPILGLVHHNSPASRLIKEAHAGWVIGLEAGQDLVETLTESYRDWREGKQQFYNKPEVVARYNRELQAAELAQIMEHIQNGD